MKKNVIKNPELRFPSFKEGYENRPISAVLTRVSDAVNVVPQDWYQEIGIRSHGKGIFHKVPVQGKTLGNKRVFWIKPDMLIFNIVFAWEQAVAKTTMKEVGMIASHRFPMFEPKRGVANIDYFLFFFLTKKGKHLLGLASPGGAGRNKTLGQKTFNELKVCCPSQPEQQKIASFFSVVDKKIEQLTRKKELLEQYKKGVMQKIFSQEIRFKDENGQDYPAWEERKLGDVGKNIIGLTYSPNDVVNVLTGMLVLRSSNIKDNRLNTKDQVRVKQGVVKNEKLIAQPLDILICTRNGSQSLIGKCALIGEHTEKMTFGAFMSIYRSKYNHFLYHLFKTDFYKRQIYKNLGARINQITTRNLNRFKFDIPVIEEQREIAKFLSSIDNKINSVQTQLTQTKNFKKGLLQKMFV